MVRTVMSYSFHLLVQVLINSKILKSVVIISAPLYKAMKGGQCEIVPSR